MKYIAYKIPFQSYQGVDYEVRIYAETSARVAPATVVLTGGEEPFVIDENDSDDVFEAVRHQTGTIKVVDNAGTGDLAGLMEKLCPENNISNPVLLIEKGGEYDNVIWQGFLNCESYSQDYVGIPQTIELPVNSLLEAMDSMYMDVDDFNGLMSVRICLLKMFNNVQKDSPILINNLYFSKESIEFLGKYIDTTIMYEKKEITTTDSSYVLAKSGSYKDMLNAIASFMGWTIREVGRDIYFQRVMGGDVYYRVYYPMFKLESWRENMYEESVVELDMSDDDDEYRSTNHTRNVCQGARSVYIGAKVDGYKLELSLPECPVNDINEYDREFYPYGIYMIHNMDNAFYNHIKHLFCSADVKAYGLIPGTAQTRGGISEHYEDVADHMDVFRNTVFYDKNNAPARQYNSNPTEFVNIYSGSWFVKVSVNDNSEMPESLEDYEDCVYCSFLPGLTNGVIGKYARAASNKPIFGIRSVMPFRPSRGYINIQGVFKGFFYTNGIFTTNTNDVIQLRLSIGDSYWNGNSWSGTNSFNAFIEEDKIKKDWTAQIQIDEVDGMLIPVDNDLHGLVTLEIMSNAGYPATSDFNPNSLCEAFISELKVAYIPESSYIYADRDENGYYTLLGGNFNEDKEISLEYASWARNNPSPTIVMNNLNDVMSEMVYHFSNGDRNMVPEKDLLNRAARFYKKIRRTIELDMPHIESLPLKRINGLDGHKYLPLSHSINYVDGVERIKMIEDINGDE